MSSCYEVLGASETDTLDEIKVAYRRKVRENHPDLGGDIEKFRKVQEAWETINSPSKRTAYDHAHSTKTYDSNRSAAFSDYMHEWASRNDNFLRENEELFSMFEERSRNLKQARDDIADLAKKFKQEDDNRAWANLGKKYQDYQNSPARYFLVKQWKQLDAVVLKTIFLALIPINVAIFSINYINKETTFLSTSDFIVASMFTLAIDALILTGLFIERKITWKMRKQEYLE